MTTHFSEAEYAAIGGAPAALLKRSKYRAVPVIVTEAGELYEAKAAKANGIAGLRFDSKAEARRYLELRVMERSRLIRNLACQPVLEIHAADVARTKVGVYRADFSYLDVATGRCVLEDAKGVSTATYRLKKKLIEAEHGVQIIEVRA